MNLTPIAIFNFCQKFFTGIPASHQNIFEGKILPPLLDWKNALRSSEAIISKTDYSHTQAKFSKFDCQNTGDYSDLYLTCDRRASSKHSEISAMTRTARTVHSVIEHKTYKEMPSSRKTNLHLLTEREQLDLVENMMRGGVYSVYEQRPFQTNNCHLPNYDAYKPSSYALMLDAINIYGGVKQNNPFATEELCVRR